MRRANSEETRRDAALCRQKPPLSMGGNGIERPLEHPLCQELWCSGTSGASTEAQCNAGAPTFHNLGIISHTTAEDGRQKAGTMNKGAAS